MHKLQFGVRVILSYLGNNGNSVKFISDITSTNAGYTIVVRKLKKEPTHVQAHLVFAEAKPNAKKPKELSLPHHHPK